VKEWGLDLHIHSALSPCSSKEMLPGPVLSRAKELGISAIAITDHNSAGNSRAFLEKGRELGIMVFPGMELQSIEDIHLICLFENLADLLAFQEQVYLQLPQMDNNKESFGEQWLVDKEGLLIGEVEQILLIGTSLSVDEWVTHVHQLGGLCIAAHVDRQGFSLWGHLACLPPELDLDGVELTPHLRRDPVLMEAIKKRGLSYVISSDAHYLADLRAPQCFARMEELTLLELKQALSGQNGRMIRTLR